MLGWIEKLPFPGPWLERESEIDANFKQCGVMIMRDVKVVYVPPVCTPKVVRGGDIATWEGVSARLIAAHVPGVTSSTYLELYYPNEGKTSSRWQHPDSEHKRPFSFLGRATEALA